MMKNPSMYNAATLLDIHTRAHESLRRLIVFCGNLTDDELRRPLTGFGFPTVLRQLEHTIGAEVTGKQWLPRATPRKRRSRNCRM
jgi:hypothetical protein